MNPIIKDYFTFNKSERRGIVFLLMLISIVIIATVSLPYFITPTKTNFDEFKAEIEALRIIENKKDSASNYQKPVYTSSYAKKEYELFKFDPNKVSTAEMEKMGFSSKLIQTIENFRNKGGHFKEKEDFKKIYGVSENLFSKLENFIDIKNEIILPKEVEDWNSGGEKNLTIVELNSTDSISLIKVKGIGSYTAFRILDSRRKWGGFYSIDQLYEVFGLKKEQIDEFKKYLIVDEALIDKRNINKAEVSDLKSIPNLKWNIAKVIVAYREKHGVYSNIEDIKKTDLVNDELYLKIAPYLTIQ